jgi:hypothetical protein
LRGQLLDGQKPLQLLKRRFAAVVRDGHEFASAAVNLQCFGSDTTTLLEEPSIKSKLQYNFRVVFVVDTPRHLGVADQIFVPVKNQKIRHSDNLDLSFAKSFRYKKSRLIQDRKFLCDGVRRFPHLLLQGSVAHVAKCSECCQMFLLVPQPEATQYFIVRTGSNLLFISVSQEDAQIARCWALIRNEVGSSQAHGGTEVLKLLIMEKDLPKARHRGKIIIDRQNDLLEWVTALGETCPSFTH